MAMTMASRKPSSGGRSRSRSRGRGGRKAFVRGGFEKDGDDDMTMTATTSSGPASMAAAAAAPVVPAGGRSKPAKAGRSRSGGRNTTGAAKGTAKGAAKGTAKGAAKGTAKGKAKAAEARSRSRGAAKKVLATHQKVVDAKLGRGKAAQGAVYPIATVQSGILNYYEYKDRLTKDRSVHVAPPVKGELMVRLFKAEVQDTVPTLVQEFLDRRVDSKLQETLGLLAESGMGWWSTLLKSVGPEGKSLRPVERKVVNRLRLRLPNKDVLREFCTLLYDAYVPFSQAAYNRTNNAEPLSVFNDARPYVALKERQVVPLLSADFRKALAAEAQGVVAKVGGLLRCKRKELRRNRHVEALLNSMMRPDGVPRTTEAQARGLRSRKYDDTGREKPGKYRFFNDDWDEEDEDDFEDSEGPGNDLVTDSGSEDEDDDDEDEDDEDDEEDEGPSSKGKGGEGEEEDEEDEDDEEDEEVEEDALLGLTAAESGDAKSLRQFDDFLGPLGQIVFYAVLGGELDYAPFVYDTSVLYWLHRIYLDSAPRHGLELQAMYGSRLEKETGVTTSGRRFTLKDKFFDVHDVDGDDEDDEDDEDGEEEDGKAGKGVPGGGDKGADSGKKGDADAEVADAKNIISAEAEAISTETKRQAEAIIKTAVTDGSGAGGRKVRLQMVVVDQNKLTDPRNKGLQEKFLKDAQNLSSDNLTRLAQPLTAKKEEATVWSSLTGFVTSVGKGIVDFVWGMGKVVLIVGAGAATAVAATYVIPAALAYSFVFGAVGLAGASVGSAVVDKLEAFYIEGEASMTEEQFKQVWAIKTSRDQWLKVMGLVADYGANRLVPLPQDEWALVESFADAEDFAKWTETGYLANKADAFNQPDSIFKIVDTEVTLLPAGPASAAASAPTGGRVRRMNPLQSMSVDQLMALIARESPHSRVPPYRPGGAYRGARKTFARY